MQNLITPAVMLVAAVAGLFNWVLLRAPGLWPYIDAAIDVFAVVACFLGAYFLWAGRRRIGRKMFAAALAVLGAAVAVWYLLVGAGASPVWEILDFLLVILLTLGAGLLFRVGSPAEAAAYDVAHITLALAGLMLIGGGVVLYNWTQANENVAWLSIHLLSISACGFGAAGLRYMTMDIFGKVVAWPLAVLVVAVVFRTAEVVPQAHPLWQAVDFLLVIGLTLGAGLLLRRA